MIVLLRAHPVTFALFLSEYKGNERGIIKLVTVTLALIATWQIGKKGKYNSEERKVDL